MKIGTDGLRIDFSLQQIDWKRVFIASCIGYIFAFLLSATVSIGVAAVLRWITGEGMQPIYDRFLQLFTRNISPSITLLAIVFTGEWIGNKTEKDAVLNGAAAGLTILSIGILLQITLQFLSASISHHPDDANQIASAYHTAKSISQSASIVLPGGGPILYIMGVIIGGFGGFFGHRNRERQQK